MNSPFQLNAEGLAITPKQVQTVLQELNSSVLDLSTPDPARYLSRSLAEIAISATEDEKQFGRNLTFLLGKAPHSPEEIMEVAEKVASVSPQQAATLMGFIVGFWNGINTADNR